MSINKTAQFNWLRRLKDRNRNNNEGGQELSFNEQEFRGLQDVARRNADAERQRVDSLVKEYRKIAEKVGRPISIPGAFELSVDNVKKVYSMEPNALWSALCASYDNCSPYASEDTAYRGRLIRSIVENRNSSAAGWGKMLEGIEVLLRGLVIDVMNLADNNRLEEGSYEWAKRVFTNKELRIPLAKEFRVSPIGPELDRFASACDLVFTTASTTAIEFIAREKAIGIVCAVNNQEQFYESLVNLRIAAPIGKFENGTWNLDLENIRELIISKESRAVLRRNCVGFIDFEGASRIVDEILLL